MLGQCSLRHRFPVCSSGGNSNRKSSFWRLIGICVFPCRPGRRGVARRARSARRSCHGVALGTAVCPGNGTTLRSNLRPTNDSWRVDETYIRVKGIK